MFSVIRSVVAVVTVTALAALGWLGYEAWRSEAHGLAKAASLPPVQQIALATDGVLDDAWIRRALALPSGATLMDLDLPQLQERLLADGQVRSVSLTRRFPATLAVHLAERSPVARVMVQLPGEQPAALLVARDGVVYNGAGYDEALRESLVWLDGFRLTRQDGRIQPIPGMEVVADLIAKARNEAPHLYATWRVVSLARLQADGEIEVRAADVERIRFGTNQDFFRQLAQLDVLLDLAQTRPDQPLREINLAVGRTTDGRVQVPVLLDVPGPSAAASPSRPAVRPSASNAFFNPQKKPSAREL